MRGEEGSLDTGGDHVPQSVQEPLSEGGGEGGDCEDDYENYDGDDDNDYDGDDDIVCA